MCIGECIEPRRNLELKYGRKRASDGNITVTSRNGPA